MYLRRLFGLSLISSFVLLGLGRVVFCPVHAIEVGVGESDLTPGYPIRLTGYAARQTESEGVHTKLFARAIAIGSGLRTTVLVTVDSCGVCSNITEEVAKRLRRNVGLRRERLAITSTHTHYAPCIVGFAPNIFAKPIPPEQQATIERYTKELTDGIESAVLRALDARKDRILTWSQGSVGFAGNRRTPGGPVDHSVPILMASDVDGTPIAVVANYACHCTTLGSGFNRTCADWAGFARDAIERARPGIKALVSIGCGADSNPSPRGGTDLGLGLSMKHGQSLATEVERLITSGGMKLEKAPEARFRRIQLPYQKHFTRAEWTDRASKEGIVGYHARNYLNQLQLGETLPDTLEYPVQTWQFGDKLAMVFLGGEVVVDYSLRLKRELDENRLWITAYANDVPCYIPSRRILTEGGYEAVDSLWYYGRPAGLVPECEDLIIGTVRSMLPRAYQPTLKKNIK